MIPPLDLIGDGIENPGNARTMMAAAAMFNAGCYFRDRRGLAEALALISRADGLRSLELQDMHDYPIVLALENSANAEDLFGCTIAAGVRAALVAGNERLGIAPDMIRLATRVVQIPMWSHHLNTINVAAASAIALFYLTAGRGWRVKVRANPAARRPDVLLLGAADHVELGSSIRSAAAFGWSRILLEDRDQVWFGCDRAVCREGRAAARRAKNVIRVVPVDVRKRLAFTNVCIVSTQPGGISLSKADLAKGTHQLIVLPDETRIDIQKEDWDRFGGRVEHVQIELPGRSYEYHYRLISSIALAECARQVGRKKGGRRAAHRLDYRRVLSLVDPDIGEDVILEELLSY